MGGKYTMRFCFLHTSNWQLGITRHFFSEEVYERFAQFRFYAIRELGRIAKEEDCQFMVVYGDIGLMIVDLRLLIEKPFKIKIIPNQKTKNII